MQQQYSLSGLPGAQRKELLNGIELYAHSWDAIQPAEDRPQWPTTLDMVQQYFGELYHTGIQKEFGLRDESPAPEELRQITAEYQEQYIDRRPE